MVNVGRRHRRAALMGVGVAVVVTLAYVAMMPTTSSPHHIPLIVREVWVLIDASYSAGGGNLLTVAEVRRTLQTRFNQTEIQTLAEQQGSIWFEINKGERWRFKIASAEARLEAYDAHGGLYSFDLGPIK